VGAVTQALEAVTNPVQTAEKESARIGEPRILEVLDE
jgi:hypothetical protein